MPDDHDSELSTLTASRSVEACHLLASASYRDMRQGTMIETAAMMDAGVISYYFYQHFEVGIFPHGHRDILPSDEDYAEMCERFGLRLRGDKGVALWKLNHGEWVSKCSSTIRSRKGLAKYEASAAEHVASTDNK